MLATRLLAGGALTLALSVGIASPDLVPHAPRAVAAGWSPTDLTNLEFWVKADVGVSTDVDGVHTWEDQSVNGRDLTQITGSKKPDNSTTKNGLTVIKFDGIDDFLDASFGATLSQPTTVFLVSRFHALPVDTFNFVFDGFGATHRQAIYNRTDEAVDVFGGANFNFYVTDTNWRVHTLVYNGASSRWRHNETELTGTAGANSLDGLTVGANNGGGQASEIEVAEMGVLSESISVADQTSLESYLNNRWAVY